MRSINVKRVAAIATGAAMIGSVLATGAFGAVSTSGDVSGLVTSIKNNLSDVQIAVGTNGAAISDGVQAAKIAAVLSSLNYVPATGVVPGTTTKKVVVQTTGGGGLQITPSVYSIEFAGSTTNTGASNGYITTVNNATLTPLTLGNVLSQTQLSAYISGAIQNFKYQEELVVQGGRYVQYHEAGPNPTGHGLYFNSPYGNILYRLNFQASGQGIPTNGSAYNEVPQITVLGSQYAIDTADLTNGRLTLYTGAKQQILEGESVQVGDATITVTTIAQVQSSSGTSFNAVIKAEKGGTTQTQSLGPLTGFDFFAAQGDAAIVTVYIEGVFYGGAQGSSVIARIGSKRIRFTQGLPFALDPNWTVNAIDITANAATNGLRSVTLQYGNPLGATPFARGTFDGTVTNGLAVGQTVNGPMNINGNPTFNLQFVGFGGATVDDRTPVTMSTVGLNASTTTSAIQVTWTDRDGVVNQFAPPDRTYANISGITNAPAGVGLVVGTTPYTIVNDKVIYFAGIDQVSAGTTTQYTPKFRIGGVNGFDLAATTNTSSSAPTSAAPLSSLLLYAGGVSGNTLSCQVVITATNAVTINGTSLTTCDTMPNSVVIGTRTVFDRAGTTTPALNLLYAAGGFGGFNNSFVMDYLNPRPAVILQDASGANAVYTLFVFDDTSTSGGNTTASGAGTTTGLQAYNATAVIFGSNSSATGANFSTTSAIAYIDQSKTTVYEPDLYHTTQGGVTLDGSTNGIITASVPEAMPNAVVMIGALGNQTAGTQTLGIGDTVQGVTIKDIQVTTTGGAGYYTPQGALMPESLIAWDTGVLKTYTIVVGGPYVNRIAAGMTAANLITQAGAQYLVAEGNKLLVAGYLATDTEAAANQLISLLKA